MKKITFFAGSLSRGGAERVISILSNNLVERGKEVEIVLYHDDEIFYTINEHVKITITEKETGCKNLFKNLVWMRKYFKNNSDIVISFLAPFNMLAIAATIFIKTPVVVADRNDPRFIPANKIVRVLRNFLYRFADGVVLQTINNQNYFSDIIKKKSTVIYNPVDMGEKVGLALRTEKKKQIVSVGRLMQQKNQVMLFEAFSEIHNEFPDYELIIYGEGPYREELQRKIDELNLNECVRMPGNKKNVHELISSAEFFVLSSDYEGMSNALIEAMCLGLPVISTDVSGARDVITEGYNGMIVKCNDTDGLVSAMKKILLDDKFRKDCATNAVKLADDLAVNKIVNQWDSFINESMKKYGN